VQGSFGGVIEARRGRQEEKERRDIHASSREKKKGVRIFQTPTVLPTERYDRGRNETDVGRAEKLDNSQRGRTKGAGKGGESKAKNTDFLLVDRDLVLKESRQKERKMAGKKEFATAKSEQTANVKSRGRKSQNQQTHRMGGKLGGGI